MKLYKLLVKEGEDGEYPSVVAVYSTLAMANRAKELCPGSFLMALPLDYIPKGCPEGVQAYRVNVDCTEGGGLISTEQIDVFSVKGGFNPAEHYWLHPFEEGPGEMCLELWAKDKEEAEASARCCYEWFKESFPDNRKWVFSSDEWETLIKERKVVRGGK
jgi:hypothetical protein